jgi:threonine dehydrogenase-like Zn-dependent dehydrogenase
VRDAVRRRLATYSVPPDAPSSHEDAPAVSIGHHASHDVYLTLVNVGDACLIEPSVTCSHCNYCKSHGH